MTVPDADLVEAAEVVVDAVARGDGDPDGVTVPGSDDEPDGDGVAGRDAVPVSELVAMPEPVCDALTAGDDEPV